MADVVAAVRHVTGRNVGAWQEVAEHGGLQPSDGYVVVWKSADDARVLAEAGFDVVVSAPDAYYLDMALDDEWSSPGASWAGTVGLDDVCAFEPGAGWSDDARRHLLGIQACVWTEHIPSAPAFDALVFPRLDAIAERAWLGRIEGDAASVASRRVSAAATHAGMSGGLGTRGPCGVVRTPSSSTTCRWRSCCGRRTSTGSDRWYTP